MKRAFTSLALCALLCGACTRVPITGRSQLNLIPESTMDQMAVEQYRSFLSQNKAVSSNSSRDASMVQRVGSRIAGAVTQYLRTNGAADRVSDYKWEFNLVENKEVNAWCMPGGKVVVYTGILPVTKDETSLAIVLGHEIAHAIARHSNERMSQQLGLQGLQMLGDAALMKKDSRYVNTFDQLFGIGTQVGVTLPHSRAQESEADHLGLIFAAMAGYDPRQAVPFWQRMATLGGGSKVPVYLSDHPDDATRIAQIQKWVPEAMKYYKPH
ncbi:M48 family metallopeptidase [Compostibacter hankyongensis]|uniref:M48 family metallopeptidase n=1 Tax=Compostibacter hankyongensis TaxID=1007089 RepID=A0ABP8G974_9BACT